MTVSRKRVIEIGEVSVQRLLRLDSLVNMLQEMAIYHTRSLGIEMSSLLDSGRTWVLSRIAVEIIRMPKLDEEIIIHTWSRKIKRFKGVRDFSFFCGDQLIASASTLWLHIDLSRRRPVRVPDDYESRYGAVDRRATTVDIEDWVAPQDIAPQHLRTVTLRLSDYDVNGHVNNAAIMQFVETAIHDIMGDSTSFQAIQLAFLREIPERIDEVKVVIEAVGNTLLFKVEREKVFVSGVASLN